MKQDDFKRELNAKELRLSLLLSKREETDVEIARLRLDIAALAHLAGEPQISAKARAERLGFESLGLSDACREIFRALDVEDDLTPSEVRQRLDGLGFETKDHSNILASITTTLKRMHLGRELEPRKRSDGKTAYRLRRPRSLLKKVLLGD